MARQLRLSLQRPSSHRREDFVVSPANAAAVEAVDSWRSWPAGALALCGPEGSGKTHLGRAWAESCKAAIVTGASIDFDALHGRPVFIDDAESFPSEEDLFHLINMAAGGALLLTSRIRPAAWTCRLPDLRSRLNALSVAELEEPDDALLAQVILKLFRERNIRPTEDVLPYLLRRMERSVPYAREIVRQIDEAADAQQRPVNRTLVRQILENEAGTPDLFE